VNARGKHWGKLGEEKKQKKKKKKMSYAPAKVCDTGGKKKPGGWAYLERGKWKC